MRRSKMIELNMNEVMTTAIQDLAEEKVVIDRDVAIKHTLNHLLVNLKELITLLADNQPVSNTPPTEASLQETVSTVLEQSVWFDTMVLEKVEDETTRVVESAVEDWFNHNFSLSDHVDIVDLVREAVSDEIEDAVSKILRKAFE
jgi:hypothetical protein